ncbi:MAG: hypothetical protein WD607_10065 [Candidatus Paceibacterota bacterium]
MSNTIHLHIGSPKTGSTSIQEIFSKNRNKLRQQDYIYPGNGMDHHFLYFASKAPQERWPRHFKGIDKNKLNTFIKNYFAEIEKGFLEEQNVVLSTEYIFFENREMVENILNYLRNFFDCIIVHCFLRDPIDYYRSYQQQLIKGQSFLQSPFSFKYNFKEVIQTWSDFSDEMNVLAFNKTENSFVKLCNKIGVDASSCQGLNHRTKSSVSLEQMILMEKVYKNIYQKYDDQLKGKLHVKTIAQINTNYTNRPELKPGIDSIIYKNHYKDLLWLKEYYGVDFTNEEHYGDSPSELPSFDGDKVTIRNVFKVQDEQTVEKYEAHVIDLLLKKLLQRA